MKIYELKKVVVSKTKTLEFALAVDSKTGFDDLTANGIDKEKPYRFDVYTNLIIISYPDQNKIVIYDDDSRKVVKIVECEEEHTECGQRVLRISYGATKPGYNAEELKLLYSTRHTDPNIL